jgi:hypothetical protein
MANNGAKKQDLGWTFSILDEGDLKKVKKEGFPGRIHGDRLPQHRGHPCTTTRISGDVSSFPPLWFLSSCPQISSWASVCVWRAAASAHAKLSFAHYLLHYFV